MAIDPEPGAPAEAGRLLALGSLVPGVVHELNNALLGLLGMLELARADATGAVADRLGIAQHAGEEIRDIARVLGALAREPLDEEATGELRELAEDAVASARTLNLVRGLEVVEVFDSGSAPVAGAAQVRQAILLLLGAAFAASGREGPLMVEVASEDSLGAISVRHSGAGANGAADPGLVHVARWASGRGGELVAERTRFTLRLPLTG